MLASIQASTVIVVTVVEIVVQSAVAVALPHRRRAAVVMEAGVPMRVLLRLRGKILPRMLLKTRAGRWR